MKGLILKDFYNVFRQWKFWGIYFVGMSFFSIFSANFSMTGILMFIMPTIAMGAFSYDEMTKWDRYALSMPISRKQIVLARYLLCGLMFAISLAFGIIINIISSVVNGNGIINIDNLIGIYSIMVTAMLFVSLQMAIMYKLGPEKARIWTILLFLIPFAGFFGFLGISTSSGLNHKLINVLDTLPWTAIGLAMGVIALLALFVSYNISIKIYSNKEF